MYEKLWLVEERVNATRPLSYYKYRSIRILHLYASFGNETRLPSFALPQMTDLADPSGLKTLDGINTTRARNLVKMLVNCQLEF